MLVAKDSNEMRFLLDYRSLNSVSRLTSYPFQTMDLILYNMAAAKASYNSTLDLRGGFI